MSRSPAQVQLSETEEATFGNGRGGALPSNGWVDRARILLLSKEGLTVEKIAAHLHTHPSGARFQVATALCEGPAGRPRGRPRSGKPHKYTGEVERQVLELLDTAPPKGYAQRNGASSARALGNVSDDHVSRILRKRVIQLAAASQVVHHHGSGVPTESRRCGWTVFGSARECGRAACT